MDDIELFEFVRQLVGAELLPTAVRQCDGADVDVAERRFLLLFGALLGLVAAPMFGFMDGDEDRYLVDPAGSLEPSMTMVSVLFCTLLSPLWNSHRWRLERSFGV